MIIRDPASRELAAIIKILGSTPRYMTSVTRMVAPKGITIYRDLIKQKF